MRGITEERLNEILNDPEGDEFELEKEFLKFLIDNECKELNAWQPIETAPKDRNILVYDPGYGHLVVIWSEFYNLWITVFGRKLTEPPTHWQELPEDPK